MKCLQVQWVAPNKEEAKMIAEELVFREIVACANIVSGLESIFQWEGKIERAKEVKVFLKTIPENFDRICALIKEKGSYKVPEILGVIADVCNPDYLEWVYSTAKVKSTSIHK